MREARFLQLIYCIEHVFGAELSSTVVDQCEAYTEERALWNSQQTHKPCTRYMSSDIAKSTVQFEESERIATLGVSVCLCCK